MEKRKLKKLMIVRHGCYGNDRRLNDLGRRQMKTLAKKLGLFLGSGPVVILSSTAIRAHESAEVLSKELKIAVELHKILWADSDHHPDMAKVLDLVRSKMGEHEVIIVVTHMEYGERLPGHFAHHELNGHNLAGFGIGTGEAWVIDCQAKDMVRITSI